MPLIRTVVFLVCCWLAGTASAQIIEAAPDWQTADSAHFRVNYRSAWRWQAERVAQAAERAYPRVTQSLGWEPRGRTEILLINQFDSPNGFSTPLPYNVIGVFLAPPDDGELLDNSDWLEMLLTHEFTHTVHLDKVRGVPGVLQTIFGRFPLFFPNLYAPGWTIEGLAVYNESDPATGRGRLRGPAFEAWLRAEAETGFLSLREINADGRALPVSKAYLYGAYFYEYLARQYGPDAIYKTIDGYSGNPPLWPRLHTNPTHATGKTMDVLWEEFLADLKQQLTQRSHSLMSEPEAAGERLAGPLFGVGSVAGLPSGATLAVIDNGLNHAKLVRFAADGSQTTLTDVHPDARIDVAPNGQVMITQPDVCRTRFLVYDLYRMRPDGGLKQLTSCERLRHAVQAGDAIVAIQQDQGRTRLLLLDAEGRQQRVLWEPPVDVSLIDIAASPDGKQVSVVAKNGGDWRVLAYDLARPDAAPRLLFTHDAPVYGLTHGPAGLEFIATRKGVDNVWRLEGEQWVQLSHTHTRVVSQSGTQIDGSLALSVVVAGGYELRRMAAPSPLVRLPITRTAAASPPAPQPVPQGQLSEPQPYSAWRSLAPRSWFPVASGGNGLAAAGATTFGSDAMGWHTYAATAQVELTQGEPLLALQYLYENEHLFTFRRDLTARAWKSSDQNDEVTSYDRNTSFQWLSVFPWIRIDRVAAVGFGASLNDVDRVHPELVNGAPPRDERMLVGVLSYNSGGSNWWSEGYNRGQRATLLYETYKPFARDGRDDYDGYVLRLDWRGYVPLGPTVLGLRYTEAYGKGFTERFQLGGAIDPQLQLGIVLDNRDVMLRGYRGDEPNLRGANARAASFEWRTPIADVDQHYMVPAVGLNRISAAAFFDIGGAWDEGHRPLHYQRGIGLEVLSEVKFLYATGLQLRLGLARGLDEPSGNRGYVSLGRAF
ncbi:hypothetical protein ACVNIS_13715 [Sphaerotilaceae bacterium SBD11-9]